MNRKNKTFDAVKMMREIRNAHYEETKDMTTEERISFYRKKVKRLRRELDEQKERAQA